VSIAGQFYLVTTVVQGREPVFHDFPLARAAVRGLRMATNAVSARWLAWVLMPDHFHTLLSLGQGSPLSTVMGLAKGRARSIWLAEFPDHYDNPVFTITPYGTTRTWWLLPGMSSPTHCERRWWAESGTIRIGIPSGSNNGA